MKTILISWLLSLMMAMTPPRQHQAVETETETAQRYSDIAEAIYEVAFDKDEKPIFYNDPNARSKTALLMLVTARDEGQYFSRDVDVGIKRGDSGKSVCLMQINIGNRKISVNKSRYLYTADDLVSDRTACFRTGLDYIRRSFGACNGIYFGKREKHHGKKYTIMDQLSIYASGSCEVELPESVNRMRSYYHWLYNKKYKIPIKDDEILRDRYVSNTD